MIIRVKIRLLVDKTINGVLTKAGSKLEMKEPFASQAIAAGEAVAIIPGCPEPAPAGNAMAVAMPEKELEALPGDAIEPGEETEKKNESD